MNPNACELSRGPASRGMFATAAHLLRSGPGYVAGLLLAACAALAPAGAVEPVPGDGMLSVCVSIPPQAWVVRRIGGDTVRIATLAEKGQDPHTFEPTPQQVQRMAGARLYFTIGVPFERVLTRKIQGAGSGLEFVDSAAGIRRRSLGEGEADRDSSHGEDHGEGDDPHVWLSTSNLVRMAGNVASALTRVAPAGAGLFESNRLVFAEELSLVHERLASGLAGMKGRSFYVYHPAFGYFGDEFGLRQKAVEIEGKSPSPRQLSDVITRARRDGVRLILVQPQFNPKTAEVVAGAVGAAVVPVDPMAANVEETLSRLAEHLRTAGATGGARE